MEEVLKDVLLAAGHHLAGALRAELASKGLCSDLRIDASGEAVRISSASPEVIAAECGSARSAPTMPLTAAARSAADEVVDAFARRLKEALQ